MRPHCPNFRMNISLHILCQIFAKLFTKYAKEWSDKYEIWHIKQLDHAKKVQNSFFVRTALHGANIFQIFFTIFFIKRIFGEVFTSHVQLVRKIFITSCFFSGWIPSGSFINLLAYGPAINKLLSDCARADNSAPGSSSCLSWNFPAIPWPTTVSTKTILWSKFCNYVQH